MRALSPRETLDVWDAGCQTTATNRALLLLQAACPEMERDELAHLPVGERDRRLLALREWAFGPAIEGRADCPRCGEALECSFPLDAIRVASPLIENHEEFRLPDSADLLAIEAMTDIDQARAVLLDRCVAKTVPPAMVEAVLARMEQADAQARVRLDFECPSCANRWTSLFDIVEFFWTEIHAWVRRLLREVHTLASAYGWSEGAIVALSPRRRQMYLDMVEG
jgi:hypothetical protein